MNNTHLNTSAKNSTRGLDGFEFSCLSALLAFFSVDSKTELRERTDSYNESSAMGICLTTLIIGVSIETQTHARYVEMFAIKIQPH